MPSFFYFYLISVLTVLLFRVVNSAEKRANHNAIERARRDSLNNRFQEIADCIPSLKDLKKPSKTIVMQKTLEYVRVVQPRFERQQAELERLRRVMTTIIKKFLICLCYFEKKTGKRAAQN